MADSPDSTHDRSETRRHLEGYLESYPGLRGRVCRILLLHLHRKGCVRIDEVYRRARRAEAWNIPTDHNRPTTRLWAADETELINGIVIDLAAEYLTPKQVDDIVWAAHRRDEAQSLETLSRMPDVPLDLLAEKVSQYASLPGATGDPSDAPEGTRVALIRRFISNQVDYISVAKGHLGIKDIAWVLDRVVGTESGSGSVGGKAAGMLLAWTILRKSEGISLPESVFLLTDAYNEFKRVNGLTDLEDHKYRPAEEIRTDFPAIREVFRNAEFPSRIMDLLRIELNRWDQVPLIVRSSSLLEDSFGATFSGIYRSIFLANQGQLEDRLRDLVGAISEIYAGVFSPDAVAYRRRHKLLDHDERMGVMIQPVIGTAYGRYYLPQVAGVAFSRNDYRWSRRIRREDGLVRLVLGLGTHAVDRVGDYARMVALKAPTLRPEGTPEEIIASSQRKVDAVDLHGGGFSNIPAADVLEAMRPEGIGDFVSVIEEDGRLSVPLGLPVSAEAGSLCITFDRLLERGEFPAQMHRILRRLEAAYRSPVDLEFAIDRGKLYALQCRPMGRDRHMARIRVPREVEAKDALFSARRYVNDGSLDDIEFVVLIDPRDYGRLETTSARAEVVRTVGRLNDTLADRRFILMGPGRWGSQDLRLGVKVTYADICHAKALIEIARAQHEYTPEPSFGTHFFQDLIEAEILYLPLYPDDKDVVFNEEFLLGSPNSLADVSPPDAGMTDVVRLLDIGKLRPGRSLRLVMDGELQDALCYLR